MAIRGLAHIQIEGYREFQRDLKKAMGQQPKAIGKAHKEVGKLIIERLKPAPTPEAVGEGAGSKVRPSATVRELVLRAGGKHRTHGRRQQWGKRQVKPFQQRSKSRPFIVQTALDHEEEIKQELLDELVKALDSAFAEAKAS